MGLLRNLRLRYAPPKMVDPDFGALTFMYVSNAPERSYWEAEWSFPPTNTTISIGLPGDEPGPRPESREFYLSLSQKFDRIVAACLPELRAVSSRWLKQDLPSDPFTVFSLSGFDLEDAVATPIRWSVSFEASGPKWLGVMIPFVGDSPGEAVVDT